MSGRGAPWWGAAMVGLMLVGCGGEGPSNWPDGRPRIDALRFLQQEPGDAYSLIFQVAWVDTDGDLGSGRLKLSINGASRSELGLTELFNSQVPPIALDAREGEMEVIVKMDSGVELNTEIDLTFVLEDESGQESNAPTITVVGTAPNPGGT